MPTRIYKDDGLLQKWKFLRKVCEDYRLSLADRLVSAELLFHHNTKTGDCFPGVKRIADALGISERQVQRSIAQLIKMKWLSSKRRYNKSNLYAFNWCNEAKSKSNDDSGVVSDKNLMTTQESWGVTQESCQ
jgi:DNA-binding transcriptional MocR family regulator